MPLGLHLWQCAKFYIIKCLGNIFDLGQRYHNWCLKEKGESHGERANIRKVKPRGTKYSQL
jgi:hypothetical protein